MTLDERNLELGFNKRFKSRSQDLYLGSDIINMFVTLLEKYLTSTGDCLLRLNGGQAMGVTRERLGVVILSAVHVHS